MSTLPPPAPLQYGTVSVEQALSEDGLSFIRGIAEGRTPQPPICRTMGFALVEADRGTVTFEGTPTYDHYNPLGTVHAGFASTLLDSCVGCAVHTMLPAGVGYTTMELKVNLVRAITRDTGPVRATGTVLHMGRRVGTAEGKLTDGNGKLLAHCTTTCMVLTP
ncbi:thioesterase superfamily protein [Caenispirillum salinarum AK4]|uniref:Thioesterase superfamily protein n=1 Tax=Caenispirillum salinarum AK4 TaxID=1238182 RepID=K9H387_9PROT|nr:PaaI family thioesterase [Caenispirillum salinarum]EKV32690.1 thioesterase superfamily protein [Caenispirillum salinarum AK4]